MTDTQEVPYRIALVTSPGWPWQASINRTLHEWFMANGAPSAHLVSAHHTPVDIASEDYWAEVLHSPVEHRIADYAHLGNRAWRIRNKEVARSGLNYALAFVYGGNAMAEHMVTELRNAGVPTQALYVG